MDEFEYLAHANYFEARILPEIVAALDDKIERLRSVSPKLFSKAIARAVLPAMDKFMRERNLGATRADLDRRLSLRVQLLTTHYLNKLLPLDYPHVLILLATVRPVRKHEIVGMRRGLVEGTHDWLNPGNVPFYVTENDEAFSKNKFEHVRTFIPGALNDGLEPDEPENTEEPKDPE